MLLEVSRTANHACLRRVPRCPQTRFQSRSMQPVKDFSASEGRWDGGHRGRRKETHQWTDARYNLKQLPPWVMYQANFGTAEYDEPADEQYVPPIAPPCHEQVHCKEAQRHGVSQRTWQTHASVHCGTQNRYRT
eukprot:806438-Pleurochrysis_carterae.AAC.1